MGVETTMVPRLELAAEATAAALLPAVDHAVRAADAAAPDFAVLVCDAASTGTVLPVPPWGWPQVWQWWSEAGGVVIVHAGCVGTPAGAAPAGRVCDGFPRRRP